MVSAATVINENLCMVILSTKRMVICRNAFENSIAVNMFCVESVTDKHGSTLKKAFIVTLTAIFKN